MERPFALHPVACLSLAGDCFDVAVGRERCAREEQQDFRVMSEYVVESEFRVRE
jgi:hypothetical protein